MRLVVAGSRVWANCIHTISFNGWIYLRSRGSSYIISMHGLVWKITHSNSSSLALRASEICERNFIFSLELQVKVIMFRTVYSMNAQRFLCSVFTRSSLLCAGMMVEQYCLWSICLWLWKPSELFNFCGKGAISQQIVLCVFLPSRSSKGWAQLDYKLYRYVLKGLQFTSSVIILCLWIGVGGLSGSPKNTDKVLKSTACSSLCSQSNWTDPAVNVCALASICNQSMTRWTSVCWHQHLQLVWTCLIRWINLHKSSLLLPGDY